MDNHPDSPDPYSESDCVGNWLDYGPVYSRGPNGETVHWCAYVFRYSWDRRPHHTPLGAGWASSAGEARERIEAAVRAYRWPADSH